MMDSSTIGNSLTPQQVEALASCIGEAVRNEDKAVLASRLREFRFLSSSELDAVLEILRETRQSNYSTLWEMIWQMDYERLPVSFEEWVEDPYYSGELHKTLWPAWKKELAYVCHPRSGITSLILTGGFGAGKCVREDAIIQTDRGFLTARELLSEFGPIQVLSESGPRRVLEVFDEGEKPSIRLGMASGLVEENTPHHRHRVLTSKMEIVWKRNDEIQIGDYLLKKPGDDSLWKCGDGGDTEFAFVMGLRAGGWFAVDGECQDSIPLSIRKSSKKVVCSFLRGLFRGFGSVDTRCSSYTLLHQASCLLWGMGILSRIYKGPGVPNSYRINIVGGESLRKFHELIESDPEFLLDPSRTTSQFLPGDFVPYFTNPPSGVSPPAVARIMLEGLNFDRVESIERGFCRMVDLTVEGDPSYVANGYISHNTFASLVAQLYRGPYLCSCTKSPQSFYGGEGEGGIDPNSYIVFALFSTALDTATINNFGLISQFIRGAKYFDEHCPADIKKGTCKIEWPSKRLILRTGSSELHAIGSNLFGFIIDEANFMETPTGKDQSQHQAYKIYHHASTRLKSRFLRYGSTPGLMCIVSSKASETSFLEKLMADNVGNPSFHVADYATWEVKGREKNSPNEFRVAIGNLYRKSEVLDTVDTRGSSNSFDWVVDQSKAKPAPEGCKVTLIPVDYYFEFLRATDQSLRDIAGIATTARNPLIWRTESVHEASEGFPYSHPFLKEEHELSLSDHEGDLLNYVDWKALTRIHRSSAIPKYHPSQPRFLHCDLGLTGDCCGISMGCPYSSQKVTTFDPKTGQVTESFAPRVWMDFMLRIRPVRGEQIDLAKIVHFILNLRNRGFPLQRVTFDGFASHMAIQIIQKSNLIPDRTKNRVSSDPPVRLEAAVLSVDRTDEPYKMLRDMLFHGLLRCYRYMPFVTEVLGLEHNSQMKKVDHPPSSSKDVSDSVAGVCYGIATSKNFLTHPPTGEEFSGLPSAKDDPEGDLMASVVDDYKDAFRVTDVVPPPVRDHRIRPLVTKLGDDVDLR